MAYQYNPFGQPSPQTSTKKTWTGRDWFVKVILPLLAIAATILAAFIATGAFNPAKQASIPALSASYAGTMIRNNDGARFSLTLSQLTENASGDFTASASINGCPAAVSGNVKASNAVSFTATESTACQDGGLIGNFTGNVDANGNLSGSWTATVNTVQILGTWSLQ